MRIPTADGLSLEAEWNAPPGARATVVLCHPHPQYGGTMRSIVVSALFEALPPRGVACLRFNFRGVEHSDGVSTGGQREPADVLAALDAAHALADPTTTSRPLVLAGWSFGADMALATHDPRVAGWVGIAPPLRFRPLGDYAGAAQDARPKLLVLAAHDEYRSPDEIAAQARDWSSTRIEVVTGASHFFVGRTERVVALVTAFVDTLAPGS